MFRIIVSANAVERDGDEDKEIQVARSLWERFFDPDPTRPLWQKTKPKIIKVPHYKPIMFLMGDSIICHPVLVDELKKAMATQMPYAPLISTSSGNDFYLINRV